MIRNLRLRILPPDIVDEVRAACAATLKTKSAEDPDADRKNLIDAFAGLRVMPSDLAKYLGHDVGTSSPAEIEDLRAIYAGIRTGETTWTAIMAERNGDEKKPDATANKLKEKLTKATKPAAKVEWEIRDNVSLTVRGALGDKVASVEQTDADQWSWWVHVDKEVAPSWRAARRTTPTPRRLPRSRRQAL